MYGKTFASMYEGSMVGAGPTVFAVWGYCIAKADPKTHTVMLNPLLLAPIIGTTVHDIKAAIVSLTSPDDDSNCKDENGKRLLQVGSHEYFLVTHEHYRAIGSADERRAYNAEMKRRERERRAMSNNVNDKSGQPASASVCASASESASGPKKIESDFEQVWAQYPKRKGKQRALTAYIKARKEGVTDQTILDGLKRYKVSVEHQRENQFPTLNWMDGGTWFNQRGWFDEYTSDSEPRRGRLDLSTTTLPLE